MTCCRGWTVSQNVNALGLTVCDLWYFEALEVNDDWVNEWIKEWIKEWMNQWQRWIIKYINLKKCQFYYYYQVLKSTFFERIYKYLVTEKEVADTKKNFTHIYIKFSKIIINAPDLREKDN